MKVVEASSGSKPGPGSPQPDDAPSDGKPSAEASVSAGAFNAPSWLPPAVDLAIESSSDETSGDRPKSKIKWFIPKSRALKPVVAAGSHKENLWHSLGFHEWRPISIGIALGFYLSVLVCLGLLASFETPTRPKLVQLVGGDADPIEQKDIFDEQDWVVETEDSVRQPKSGQPLRGASAMNAIPDEDAQANMPFLLPGANERPDSLFPDNGSSTTPMDDLGEGLDDETAEGTGAVDFFNVKTKGNKVVFVIDRSHSMRTSEAWSKAQAELVKSIQALSPAMEFQVVLYNQDLEILGPKERLIRATPSLRDALIEQLLNKEPEGGTDYENALKEALKYSPDVVYLLTDAAKDDVNDVPKIVRSITKMNQQVVKGSPASIHVIHFHHERNRKADQRIAELSEKNGGTYRLITIPTQK